MNGVGKSTIATAMKLQSESESLSDLQAFGSATEPQCAFSQPVNKILLFNEAFVDQIVFQESEVIQNAFEVFIKTPEYEERHKSIDKRLKNIRVDISENPDIQRIISVGTTVLSRFVVTQAGQLKKTGLMRSLISSESFYQVPEGLSKFKPLMEKDYIVDWVAWKHEGSNYDDNQICPFCTYALGQDYESEKKLFASSYTKSNVRNIKEMLSYFHDLEDFMEPSKTK
jgi:hypothetical protein